MKALLIAFLSTVGIVVPVVQIATANDQVGSVYTSGWLFKDSINITAFDDPDYPEITCYVTSADRSMSWENATDSSIACRLMKRIEAKKAYVQREEVFAQSAGMFFKYQRVDRFYDAKRNALVYISYVRKNSGDNHAHAISVVPLN
ncbi:CreA protein [Rhizobium phage RHph_I1_18]|nr:CreA protein [Rhizobium phage RHph_I1_18]